MSELHDFILPDFDKVIKDTGLVTTWQIITQNTNLEVTNGYLTQNTTQIELELPTGCDLGDAIKILHKGSDNIRINPPPGGSILFSTLQTSNYIETFQQNSTLELICLGSNDEFMVASSIGNFNLG